MVIPERIRSILVSLVALDVAEINHLKNEAEKQIKCSYPDNPRLEADTKKIGEHNLEIANMLQQLYNKVVNPK